MSIVKSDVLVFTVAGGGLKVGTNTQTDFGNGAVLGTNVEGDIVIPKSFQGMPVTGITIHAFRECQKITTVTILARITHIDHAAFYHCCRLTNINIPSTVTFIGRYAFSMYKSREAENLVVMIEKGSKLNTLSDYSFEYNSNLTIIYCGKHIPTCSSTAFTKATHISIFSQEANQNFCGFQTGKGVMCSIDYLCQTYKPNHSNFHLKSILFYVLYFSK